MHPIFLLIDPDKLSFKRGDQLELLDGDGFQFLHGRKMEKQIIDEIYCCYGRNCTTEREGYMKPSSGIEELLDNLKGNKLKQQ